MPEDRAYISYSFRSPRMDQSVPPNQVQIGSLGRLSGVDGRFSGALRKYYGNKLVVDLDGVEGLGGIDAYNGSDFIRQVTFQKRDTSTVFRGFVIRWDSQNNITDEQIDLVYKASDGGNWTTFTIWNPVEEDSKIASTLEIDCAVDRGFLLVAIDTKPTMTIYWKDEETGLVAVESGPGIFSSTLTAPTLDTTSVNTGFQLNGAGTYQVAWRFYDSKRGIYSALSNPLTIRLDHYKTTKAIGTINFSKGGDNGLFIDGDTITINGRVYEADDDSDYTEGNIPIDITDLDTISKHCQALADAINGDSSVVVTAAAQATNVLLESKIRGAEGNGYTLSKTEVGPNQNDIIVSGTVLTGGGVITAEPEEQCKAVINFPAEDDVLPGAENGYDVFSGLFDTIDIFRTIDLGDSITSTGAIFYLEQSVSLPSEEEWATFQVNIGTIIDEALPFQTMYDPAKDIVTSPPQSGTIGRYMSQTYMAQAASVGGGYDTLFSSPQHISPEYFSTYNKRTGDSEDGRPLRFLPAGDSLFQLSYNAIVHIFKSGKLKPIQISRLHKSRGIVGKEVAHSSGNSIFMISGLGMAVLNGTDGSLGAVSAVDRIILDDWKLNLADVKSCYDARLNASFFLNSVREEILVLWHTTQTCSMMDGTNFVGVTSGPDMDMGKNDRAFFITKTGRIVSPDIEETGSGTMWGLTGSITLNGTATKEGTTLEDGNASLSKDMEGAKLYMVTGNNAGIGRTIGIVNTTAKTITFVTPFPNSINVGDTYAISPVPFSARAWPVQAEEISRFNRWVVAGVSVKARKLDGFTDNPNNKWRVGAYRNSASSIETTVVYPEVSSNPAKSVGVLNIDGVDIEPYVEQIASGVKFELTDMEFTLTLSDSRANSE